MSPDDFTAIALTAKLAALSTLLLLILGTPIAWWLARSRSSLRSVVGAVVTLPLVLPPAVLGFYLLVLLGPQGPVGRLTQALGLGLLNKLLEGWTGAVLAKIAVLVFIVIFIQKRPQGIFAMKGRSAEA